MSDEIEELTKALKDAKAGLEKQQAALVEAHREVMAAAQRGEKMEKTMSENIDKAIAKANEAGESVIDLAKKIDDMEKRRPDADLPKTLRDTIAKAIDDAGEKYELLKRREGKTLRLDITKAITTATAAGLLPNPYVDSLVSKEMRTLRIRDLLTIVPVTTDSVRYGVQSTRTNNAAIVAEGALKPTSNYAWDDATATIQTIAHITKMSVQALADAPRLAAEVEAEMRYGLDLVEETEIVAGDATSGHLSGLIHNATAYAAPSGVDATNVLTSVDKLRIAILQVALGYFASDGIVLHPTDVANIELIRRDAAHTGGYIFGQPDNAPGILRLWRVPVVESVSMTVGNFLVGALKYSTTLYEREGTTVLISTENEDDFIKNLATMRCESRIGLAVRRPLGLVTGALALA